MAEIYFPNVAINLKSMPSEELATTLQEYHSARRADEPDRRRCIRNMMVALGLDYDQWEQDLSADLQREGRIPKTYNFSQYYIRGLAGNFLMNWYDPKFVDKGGDGKDVSWAANGFQTAWYAQKELYNYKASISDLVWNGLTYRGVEEICIDRSKEPGGGIRFDSIRPDMIMFEQIQSGQSIAVNSRKAWKRFQLTPGQMINIWPHMEGDVRSCLERLSYNDKESGEQHEPAKLDHFERRLGMSPWGSKYEVTEYYHLEWEKVTKVIHSESGRELPEFGFEVGTEDDYYSKVMWGAANGLQVTAESITTCDCYEPVLYCTTFCEALNIILENRKDERQIGRLPFFDWSFITQYGKSVGVIDLLLDPQQDINKREMAKTKILSETPIAGKYWAHPEAYGNDIQKKVKFDEDFNDPAKLLHLDEDAPPGVQLFGVMQGNQIPSSILQDETTKIDFMNRIASLPLAMQGISQYQGESGVHLGRKVIEGSVMQRIPLETLMQHENYKTEAWIKIGLKMWQSPLNYNRMFKGTSTIPDFIINKFQGYNDEGKEIIENDLSTVSRIDFIISQSKENDYMRQAKRELDAAILNSIRPTQTNGAAIAAFVTDLINAADYADEEHKTKALKAGDLYYELEMENGYAALAAAKMNRANAETQLQQIQAASQQRQGQQQGAAPSGMPPGMQRGMGAAPGTIEKSRLPGRPPGPAGQPGGNPNAGEPQGIEQPTAELQPMGAQ